MKKNPKGKVIYFDLLNLIDDISGKILKKKRRNKPTCLHLCALRNMQC